MVCIISCGIHELYMINEQCILLGEKIRENILHIVNTKLKVTKGVNV